MVLDAFLEYCRLDMVILSSSGHYSKVAVYQYFTYRVLNANKAHWDLAFGGAVYHHLEQQTDDNLQIFDCDTSNILLG